MLVRRIIQPHSVYHGRQEYSAVESQYGFEDHKEASIALAILKAAIEDAPRTPDQKAYGYRE